MLKKTLNVFLVTMLLCFIFTETSSSVVAGSNPTVGLSVKAVTENSITLHIDLSDYPDSEDLKLYQDNDLIYSANYTPIVFDYTVKNLSPGVTYNFKLDGKDSPNINYYRFSYTTTSTTKNAAPSSVSYFYNFDTTSNSTRLYWGGANYATSYVIKRDGKVVYTGSDTSFLDKGLVASHAYNYSIYAKNDYVNGDTSLLSVTTAKEPTVGLNVKETTENSITLHIDLSDYPNSEDLKLYQDNVLIYSAYYTPIVFDYTVNNLSPGVTYNFMLDGKDSPNMNNYRFSYTATGTTYKLPPIDEEFNTGAALDDFDYLKNEDYYKSLEEQRDNEILKEEQALRQSLTLAATSNEYYTISVTYNKQAYFNFCGVAAGRQALSFHKQKSGSSEPLPTQDYFGRSIGTLPNGGGTSSTYLANGLNQYKSVYKFSNTPYIVGNIAEFAQPAVKLETRVKATLRDKATAPILLTNTKYIDQYRGTEYRHYVTVSGYDQAADSFRIVDPNHHTEYTSGGTYWSRLRTSVSSTGIARAVYEADKKSTNPVMVW
jgi:hypothetical protein